MLHRTTCTGVSSFSVPASWKTLAACLPLHVPSRGQRALLCGRALDNTVVSLKDTTPYRSRYDRGGLAHGGANYESPRSSLAPPSWRPELLRNCEGQRLMHANPHRGSILDAPSIVSALTINGAACGWCVSSHRPMTESQFLMEGRPFAAVLDGKMDGVQVS